MWGKGVSETTGGQSGDCEYCLVCALFSLHQSLLFLQSSLKQSHQLIPLLPHTVVAMWCPNGSCIFSYVIIPLYKTLFENRNKTKICSLLFPLFSPQFDHDPRQPAYIATQGPLAHTVADFWQVSTSPLCFSTTVFLPVMWIYLPCDPVMEMMWVKGQFSPLHLF